MFNRILFIPVIRIDNPYVISMCQVNPLIHSIIKPLVLPADQRGYVISVFFYDLKSSIRRSSVDDNILRIFVCLSQNTPDGCLYGLRRIKTHRNNRNQHILHIVIPPAKYPQKIYSPLDTPSLIPLSSP